MKKVEVKWVDAADDTEVALHKITNSKDFLVERTTVGWLAVEDEDGVVLIRDMDQDKDCEICAIPKQMLVKIK